MNNNPIGIMDSGVGGLSVWREIVRELPHESTIYIADSKNIPYGTKTPAEIHKLARQLVLFLLAKQVKMIVIACNTITVTCIDALRVEFPDVPIIGTVPVVKTAAEVTKNKKIGILSTVRTSKSSYQKHLIQTFASDCEVICKGTDTLVPFVEQGITTGAGLHHTLQAVLHVFKHERVDTIALACTHFPFLDQEIQRVMGPSVKLLEPSGAIARHARRILEYNLVLSNSNSAPHHAFHTTGDEQSFNKVLKLLLNDQLNHKDFTIQLATI